MPLASIGFTDLAGEAALVSSAPSGLIVTTQAAHGFLPLEGLTPTTPLVAVGDMTHAVKLVSDAARQGLSLCPVPLRVMFNAARMLTLEGLAKAELADAAKRAQALAALPAHDDCSLCSRRRDADDDDAHAGALTGGACAGAGVPWASAHGRRYCGACVSDALYRATVPGSGIVMPAGAPAHEYALGELVRVLDHGVKLAGYLDADRVRESALAQMRSGLAIARGHAHALLGGAT